MTFRNRKVAELLLETLTARGEFLVVAESCTGGLISSALTSLPGISRIFWGGYVVYDNEAKKRMLGVTAEAIDIFGAVSEETAVAMAQGALSASGLNGYSLSVTGIAGPSGGSVEKPVGTVCFGVGHSSGYRFSEKCFFSGNRDRIRKKAVAHAFDIFNRLCLTGKA